MPLARLAGDPHAVDVGRAGEGDDAVRQAAGHAEADAVSAQQHEVGALADGDRSRHTAQPHRLRAHRRGEVQDVFRRVPADVPAAFGVEVQAPERGADVLEVIARERE
ncbi:hypothetical protein D9M72_437280 [compost metagenome]